jgi:hypothetical protein
MLLVYQYLEREKFRRHGVSIRYYHFLALNDKALEASRRTNENRRPGNKIRTNQKLHTERDRSVAFSTLLENITGRQPKCFKTILTDYILVSAKRCVCKSSRYSLHLNLISLVVSLVVHYATP